MISGKYRIVSLIGIGGVGRVYLARHIELDTDVAIKMLRPEMGDRPDAVQRFSREARASVRLHSERIARVLDVGTHEGKPYFVMEYLVGTNLLEVRQQGDIDIATLCEFFIQACEGLAVAHAQGVVHRDIKPENLFVVRDSNGWRSLKLLDFGISKISLTGKHSDVDLASMRTEAMMGTPHYISPEQIRSTKDVDHRTDIWSLGAVMFEVLSGGVLPFREEREFTALIAEVLEQPHRSLLDVAPNVPERLGAIIDRCLAKDCDQRYQTVAEVALDLLPLAPVRARASAERAVAAMQAAGMMAVNGDFDSLRPRAITRSDWPSVVPSQGAPASIGSLSPAVSSSRTTGPLGPPLSSVPVSGEMLRPIVERRVPPERQSSPPQRQSAPPEPELPLPPIVITDTLTSRTPQSRESPSARPAIQSAPASLQPALTSLADDDPVALDSAQRRRKVWLVLLLAAALLITVAALAMRGDPSEREAARTPTQPPSAAAAPSVAPAEEVHSAPAPSTAAAAVPPAASSAAERKPSSKPIWIAPHPAAVAPVAPPPAPVKAPEPSSGGKLELKRER
jgi:serine/threonine protein kinase